MKFRYVDLKSTVLFNNFMRITKTPVSSISGGFLLCKEYFNLEIFKTYILNTFLNNFILKQLGQINVILCSIQKI